MTSADAARLRRLRLLDRLRLLNGKRSANGSCGAGDGLYILSRVLAARRTAGICPGVSTARALQRDARRRLPDEFVVEGQAGEILHEGRVAGLHFDFELDLSGGRLARLQRENIAALNAQELRQHRIAHDTVSRSSLAF